MKTLKKIILFAIFFSPLLKEEAFAQCQPMIVIDGNNIVVDEISPTSLKLPSWLKATQTLNIGQFVYSISVIEFTVNGTALDYSQNLSITASTTVPSGKVWKIEAINKNPTLPSFSGTYNYTTAGTYTFTAPPCASTAHIQVWGAGGGSGAGNSCIPYQTGGGGGGGGYAEGFYQLTSGASYTITVGAGGAGDNNSSTTGGTTGGTSSVGTIGISATGGIGGQSQWCGSGGTAGGAGGTGSGQLNFAGVAGGGGPGVGGAGGNNGGAGGALGSAGTAPGGGGGGPNGSYQGSAGAAGKVIITFGASSTTTRVPCVVMDLKSSDNTQPACPTGWTEVCNKYVNPYYARTCTRCD